MLKKFLSPNEFKYTNRSLKRIMHDFTNHNDDLHIPSWFPIVWIFGFYPLLMCNRVLLYTLTEELLHTLPNCLLTVVELVALTFTYAFITSFYFHPVQSKVIQQRQKNKAEAQLQRWVEKFNKAHPNMSVEYSPGASCLFFTFQAERETFTGDGKEAEATEEATEEEEEEDATEISECELRLIV